MPLDCIWFARSTASLSRIAFQIESDASETWTCRRQLVKKVNFFKLLKINRIMERKRGGTKTLVLTEPQPSDLPRLMPLYQ
jgi:hypothetical protein